MKAIVRRLLACAALLAGATAHAQLFRTYLSVTGNDLNPCTVAAPCRLLPAALAAVADGGEVWILDSGNYNTSTVSVAKSVSILAVPGEVGSFVSQASGAALTIAAPSAHVALRNIVVIDNATSHGIDGVQVSNGAALTVDGCLFANLARYGVYVAGASALVVRDSVFRGNAYGIHVENGATADITRADFLANASAVFVQTHDTSTTRATVSDSVVSGNNSSALWAFAWVDGGTASMQVTRSTLDHNAIAVEATGIAGAFAITISGNTIVANSSNWYAGPGGVIRSLGNNFIADAPQGNVGSLTPVSLQ